LLYLRFPIYDQETPPPPPFLMSFLVSRSLTARMLDPPILNEFHCFYPLDPPCLPAVSFFAFPHWAAMVQISAETSSLMTLFVFFFQRNEKFLLINGQSEIPDPNPVHFFFFLIKPLFAEGIVSLSPQKLAQLQTGLWCLQAVGEVGPNLFFWFMVHSQTGIACKCEYFWFGRTLGKDEV